MPNVLNLTLEPSPACIALTKRSEGLELTAYMDEGEYSVGYGHRGVPEGTVWTLEECEDGLTSDYVAISEEIKALVNVPLTQGQFDGLADWTYEFGSGRLQGSTLLKLLNESQYSAAGEQLLRWIYKKNGQGQEVEDPGLLVRREAELALWNS